MTGAAMQSGRKSFAGQWHAIWGYSATADGERHMTALPRRRSELRANEVEVFLQAHPQFLSEHPELYRTLAPPVRLHGEALADHMAAMLQAERNHAAAMAARADSVLAAGRAAAGLSARVQDAVLALIAATDPAECVATEFAGLLAVDAAALCAEDEHPAARKLPPGTVDRLLAGSDVVFRHPTTERQMLHHEAAGLARYDALVRVRLGSGLKGLIALAARGPHMLDPTQGTGALAFLGRAVAAALDK
jgi:uncharacterized protein YigA (DUF484 family)